jgi:hypothetical protein
VYTNKIIRVLLIALAFLYSASYSQEVTKTGTTASKFLSVGIGPRANSLAGAFTSIADDASAMYWNPAGIAQLKRYEGIFTYTKLFADINLNYFGLVIPLGDIGSFGLNVTALNYGEMEITTEQNPEGLGTTFTAGSYAFGLAYARYITEEFMVGINAKYIRDDIFNSSASGFAFDIGTIFDTPFWEIRFSSSITNYGTRMQMSGDDLLIQHDSDPTRAGNNDKLDAFYSTDKFELPLRLQTGLSRAFSFLEGQRLILAIDVLFPNDNAQYANVGGELSFLDNLIALRAGYRALFLTDDQEGLTLGAGLNYDGVDYFGISVDYAYQQYQFLGDTHSFGVILRF